MEHCTDYEVEFSAMLDGECDPATLIKLMDHMVSCPSCRDFYRNLRSFQDLVDEISPTVEPDTTLVPIHTSPGMFRKKQRRNIFGVVPQWAWGSAAVLVLVVGLWATGASDLIRRSATGAIGGELVIKLEENKGNMDERRFVGIVAEVLRADRRYRHQMYEILGEIEPNEGSAESRGFSTRNENEYAETHGEILVSVDGRKVRK